MTTSVDELDGGERWSPVARREAGDNEEGGGGGGLGGGRGETQSATVEKGQRLEDEARPACAGGRSVAEEESLALLSSCKIALDQGLIGANSYAALQETFLLQSLARLQSLASLDELMLQARQSVELEKVEEKKILQVRAFFYSLAPPSSPSLFSLYEVKRPRKVQQRASNDGKTGTDSFSFLLPPLCGLVLFSHVVWLSARLG